MPYSGIQEDEALVALPIYGPVVRDYRIRIFHRDIPLMVMDYNGALKSWLYWPIFHLFQPSSASLRFPVLLIGASTIGLFYCLLHRIAGTRAALAGCFLLATDTTFLLTTEFDWGPVAIQHLMLVAACLSLLTWAKSGSAKFLAAGCFALGLGLWDKALFAWVIVGLAVAAAVVFPKELWARLSAKNLAAAFVGFLLGVWPLLVFNLRHDGRTIQSHPTISASGFGGKADVLRASLNGSGLFDYMLKSSQPPEEPFGNLLLPALIVSLVAAPFLRTSRRAILFALVFMAATWIQMALTANAGGAVHHAVLLWPFPQFAVALACARLGRAPCLAAIAVLFSANLLVTNQYRTRFIHDGPSVTWSDAIYPLSDSLRGLSGEVFVMDWDILNPLYLLHQGQLNLHVGFDSRGPDTRQFDSMLAAPDAVFIAHTRGNGFFPASNQRFEDEATARGYRKELLRTVDDGHGRHIFEVYRIQSP